MKYGYFDDAKREYVITDPRTPTKWINYVGSLKFGGFVDHTGGALLCKGDPALNRITKYIPQLPASQWKGSTLYFRFPEGAGYKVFSPLYVPTLDPYEKFECHVGLGYTRWITKICGVRTEITVFVPTGEGVFVTDVQVTNETGKPLALDAIPVIEYTHFDALKQFTNADWVPQTMVSKAHRDGGNLVLAQYAFMMRDIRQNYFTANIPASSFETDRRLLLGDNEYATWQSPRALQQPELSSYEALRGDNVGALLLPLGTLAPGESKRFTTMLTQQEGKPHESLALAKKLFAQYGAQGAVEKALSRDEPRLGRLPRAGAGEDPRREHEQHAQRAQSASVLHDQELVARFVALPARIRRAGYWLSRQLARRHGRHVGHAPRGSRAHREAAQRAEDRRFCDAPVLRVDHGRERGRLARDGRSPQILWRRPPVDRARRLRLSERDGRSRVSR